MILKDLNSKPATTGLPLARNLPGKHQMPDAIEADDFGRLATRESKRVVKDSENKATERENSISQKPYDSIRFEGMPIDGSPQPSAFGFDMEMTFITKEIGQKIELRNTSLDPDESKISSASIKPAGKSNLQQMPLDTEHSARHKLQQNALLGRTNLNASVSYISAGTNGDLPINKFVKHVEEPTPLTPYFTPLPNLFSVLPAQTASRQTLDLPHLTGLQIEHVKRNSSGVLTSFELVLEPAELGRITARLQQEDGRVTLILSAEHKNVADDFARDGSLLLRVLGEHIRGIETMVVQVKTDSFGTFSGGTFSEFATQHNGQKSQNRRHESVVTDHFHVNQEAAADSNYTTLSRIIV